MQSIPSRRDVLKVTGAGLVGSTVLSGTASAVERYNSYYANSKIYLHSDPDTSTTFGTRRTYTGMHTIDGPEYNDGYTWWRVEINGDRDYYRRRRAWVAEKDMSKSHFAYASDNEFTSSHCENRGHDGVDMAYHVAGTSRPILAAQEGTARLYDLDGYGNTIIIYHDNNYQTLYAHLSDFKVSDGEYVDKYQYIGDTGNSGDSRGVHLHQELRYDGTPLEWPHDQADVNGNEIRMWRKTGIPQAWDFIDC